ncbi:MAG: hypothetical protein ACJAVV_001076 [Alphaproteobacteria bacterium]|jgi:hypothetical protein
MKLTIVGLLTLASLSACSTLTANLPNNNTLLKEVTKQDGRACIRSNDINGFGILDDDVISIDGRRGEYYLATTLYRCNSLNISPQLAFKGNFAEFCGGGRASVITGDETCPVNAIYKFDSREDAFATFDVVTNKRAALREELKKEAAE